MSTQSWVIERLGHHGDGVAEGPVFAPMTLPGEVVSGKLEGQRIGDVRIETPSDDRVRPPCRHFKSCGGCAVQHASDAFVVGWKQAIVETALRAQGIDASYLLMHVSPPKSRRRATFSARRTKKGALAGFHARGSDAIIEIPDCQLLHPELMRGTELAAVLAQEAGSRKGEVSIACTMTAAGLDVDLRGAKPLDGPLRAVLGDIARRFGLSRLSHEGEIICQEVPPAQSFGRAQVVPPPGAFLQATQEGEAALVADVRAALDGAGKVADLFAGCGTFSFPLAEQAQVHAVEGARDMIAALESGWRNVQGLRSMTAEARDLFRDPLRAEELAEFDGVCLDPPRAGAEAQVRELAQSDVARIAYVSCSPASFARDARHLLAAGYVMGPLRVVDQFRWSSHVELVTSFSRPSA
ncbi:class I SAM-dependent RNA methyltransferase [Roseovarius sp. C7]|uniref:class I SAM-dependent RNA methyltransferase n=1 Tax=Roseovarius sp. C7 TaxID=3398643 RepID=UPI0039F6736D